MRVSICINEFKVIKISQNYKTKTAFIFLEAGDGTIRPLVQRFLQNLLTSEGDCFEVQDYWCNPATKNH